MKERVGSLLAKYIKENSIALFLLLIVFVIGILAGAFTVNTLNSTQKGELYSYINGFLEAKDVSISQGELFKHIFFNYLKLVLTLWFLGVTVVGIPLIVGLVGFKGFTIGFTVGFMLDVFTDLRGILFIISSVIPLSFIILPCIVILCVSGIRFSLFLLNGGNQKKTGGNEIKARLIYHTVLSSLVLGVIAVGALVESLIMPFFLNVISSHIYK